MDLSSIGFYTLNDERSQTLNWYSPIARAEVILTDKCNLKCPYCRGLAPIIQGSLDKKQALQYLKILINNGVKNIRFSGGEPTLCEFLDDLIFTCKLGGLEHIAISTNGTADIMGYKYLMTLGVNDFSISLDAGCCAIGEKMTGGSSEAWYKAVNAIQTMSEFTYVTVGVVFNDINYASAVETIEYIDILGPSDIRIISSAQYNKALEFVSQLNPKLVNKYPILKYRVTNFKNKISIRGIETKDAKRCYLVLDDLAIAGQYHFPCIIWMREGGVPIGRMTEDFRKDRITWFKTHNVRENKICRENCLDVCVAHNNECALYFPKVSWEDV